MVGSGKLTYETLFDILRNEKSREELQSLDKDFYAMVVEYLKEKQQLIADNEASSASSDGSASIFSDIEREKTLKQLENAKKLIRELYERREKKIIGMSIIDSRAGGLLDTSGLLEEEKELFLRSSKLLEGFRADVLYRLVMGKTPRLIAQNEAQIESNGSIPQSDKAEETLMIRFIEQVPKFVGQGPQGKGIEYYGPFEPDEMATIPSKLAQILINKGKAEPVRA